MQDKILMSFIFLTRIKVHPIGWWQLLQLRSLTEWKRKGGKGKKGERTAVTSEPEGARLSRLPGCSSDQRAAMFLSHQWKRSYALQPQGGETYPKFGNGSITITVIKTSTHSRPLSLHHTPYLAVQRITEENLNCPHIFFESCVYYLFVCS